MSPIPGWYQDPAGSPGLRFWDGQSWTAATSPAEPEARAQLATAARSPQPAAPSWAARPDPAGQIPTPRGGEYALSLPARPDPPVKPKSNISGRLVAAVVGAVALAAGAVVLLNQHHGGPVRVSAHTTITMPAQVAGLPQIHTSQIDELNRVMAGSSVPKPHLVGFYGTAADAPTAFMMVAKYPQTTDQVAHNLSLSLRALDESIGNLIQFQTTDPGPLGGQMRCATVVQQARSATVCMFEDTDVLGVTFSYGTAAAPGPDAVTLRDAIEHRV